MIGISAPIIPFEEAGGIKLYSTLKDMKFIIENRKVKAKVINNLWICYEIVGCMYMFFNLINGKLFKITTLEGYKGMLWNKIGVGMNSSEFRKIEPSFTYDDFEEIYETEKGVIIETDAINDNAIWISVYVKELFDDNFDDGDW